MERFGLQVITAVLKVLRNHYRGRRIDLNSFIVAGEWQIIGGSRPDTG